MQVFASRFVERGAVYLTADLGHPELALAANPGDVDGTVIYCHPDEVEEMRDLIAGLGEFTDPNVLWTAVRKRQLGGT